MSMKLSKNLTLPSDAATQAYGIYGIRGSGKTYMAGKMAELMCDSGNQTVIVDPIGNWWGLRLGKNGKSVGIDIPIIGGQRGQLPLEHTAGSTISNFLVDTRSSAILDVSMFSKSQRKHFIADLAEQLTARQKLEPSPIHLIFEEAHLFAPQRCGSGDARMLGAIEDIVRLGRNWGIGSTLISQRPQSVNTEVRNQGDPLVVMRLVGSHERKAIEDWMKHQGADVEDAIKGLATLAKGDGYFWSPGYMGIFCKVRCYAKRTYDSTATPTAQTAKLITRALKPVDLEALETAMADAIEKQKANDPKLLKKRVAELERELAKARESLPDVDAAIKKRDLEWESEVDQLRDQIAILKDRLQLIAETIINDLEDDSAKVKILPKAKPVSTKTREANRVASNRNDRSKTTCSINATQQRIIDAIGWWESIGVASPSLPQVGAVALISYTSGHFSNVTGPLSTQGLIERSHSTMRLTEKGHQLCNPISTIRSLDEYHDAIRRRVQRMKKANGATLRILNAIIDYGGEEIEASEVGSAASLDHKTGHFSNSIGPLSTLGFIERRGGFVIPTDLLFPNELS